MIYRELLGEKVSLYGMGCMRLPLTDPADQSAIDVEHATKMVEYAYDHGCNYFDTAWPYHDGKSEGVIAKALSQYPRESYNLVTKFPGFDPTNWGKNDEVFQEQLRRCNVEYFDYYLIHNVCEMNIDAYLDEEKYHTRSYFTEQRAAGRIRHLGFSTHGNLDVLKRFLETWGDVVEFMQIQLNYVDYEFQDAKAKLELAAQYNLPVIVMEPLRGGMLAKASEEEAAQMRALRPDEGIVGWALRYLQGFDQVKVILNGCSNLQQTTENMGYFEAERPLTDAEQAVLTSIVNKRLQSKIMPCTGCHYCTSHCPQEIDIPQMMTLFNEHSFTGGGFIAPMALAAIPQGQKPQDCIGCGSCAAVCPQQIDIPQVMSDFASML